MAHWRGTIKGSGAEVSRTGSIQSGLRGEVNGWRFGVEVLMDVSRFGVDTAAIYLTSGSSGAGLVALLGHYDRRDLERLLCSVAVPGSKVEVPSE